MKTTYGLPKKREEVIEELQTAFANQNLDETEYENRLNEALAAKSVEDLESIVSDFPSEIKSKLFTKEVVTTQTNKEVAQKETYSPATPATTMDTYRSIMGQDKKQIAVLGGQVLHFFAIMSSQKVDFRRSQLEGNRFKIHVESLLGETVIDLRNEDLNGKHVEIIVGGGLGSIKVLVPKGGNIQSEAQIFGGNFEVKDKQKSWLNKLTGKKEKEHPDIAFSLSLHGTFWLGNVEVIY